MKKKLCLGLCCTFLFVCILPSQPIKAQEMGVSFSYFIPKNGYFSTPVSPFSIRGLGLKFNNVLSIETGFTLYRMAGLNITGMDSIESTEPMLGPNFTFMIPLELALTFGNEQHRFKIHGGGFLFYGFDNRLNYGNIDRAIREKEGWAVANADFSFNHGLGLGVVFGADYTVWVNKNMGIKVGASYYIGAADLNVKGSYAGNTSTGPLIVRDNLEYPDSQVDYTGLELTLGAVFKTK